ncbi:MAG: hypothetical protein RLZZ127_458 [Planctomycetota bacterium]
MATAPADTAFLPAGNAPLGDLAAKARTVTGANLKGTVRLLSLAEIEASVQAAVQAASAKSAAAIAAAKADADKRVAELEQRLINATEDARRRQSEAEAAVHAAQAEAAAAAAKAREESAARIKELERIIASDDARTRVVFLEQEVARLGALVDRYEAGLEFITAIEQPDHQPILTAIAAVRDRVPATLAGRLDQLTADVEAAARAVGEGLAVINDQHKGSIYGVTDLLEHSLRLQAASDEIASIQACLAR